MKIVIVEDEIRIREGIQKLLKKLDRNNVVIGEAGNGEEGIRLVKELHPDVIITDIKMPVMDGLEMLKQLYGDGCSAKAIVLSAYSEFEYARQAMKLGVTEYLLKPVALGDFTQALEHVSSQLEKEKEKEPEQVSSLKQILKGIINGDLQLDQQMTDYVERKYGIREDTKIAILIEYFEEWETERIKRAKRSLQTILEQRRELSFCILEDEKQKMLQAFLYGYESAQDLKRYVQLPYLKQGSELYGMAMAWTEAPSPGLVEQQFREVSKILEWSISLGDEVIISYPEVQHVQTSMCVYPVELENQMKLAMCMNQPEVLEENAKRFHAYFKGGKLYEPGKIKECYVRYFWSMINYGKEMGYVKTQQLEQQVLLEKILQARTWAGLKKVTDSILETVSPAQKEGIENLVVKRAVAMIQEYYKSGVTLEEIASSLNLTPEYLGTQFHREMGVTFSTYIKTCRITKAKELLLGTQLKLYEVAERVGYSDAKYFSKVFKEAVGQLPGDYRRTHR